MTAASPRIRARSESATPALGKTPRREAFRPKNRARGVLTSVSNGDPWWLTTTLSQWTAPALARRSLSRSEALCHMARLTVIVTVSVQRRTSACGRRRQAQPALGHGIEESVDRSPRIGVSVFWIQALDRNLGPSPREFSRKQAC